MRNYRATASGIAALAMIGAAPAAAKNWGEWTAPVSVEALPGSSPMLNTPAIDGCSSLSPDGTEMFFASNRPGSRNIDIWVAQRLGPDAGWGTPTNLGPAVNSDAVDVCPTMTRGGRLYFTSMRDDPQGDLYVARRGPRGWEAPVRLGPNVNSAGIDEAPSFYEDEEGRQVMLFSSSRSGRSRIYYSVDFGPAQLAPGGVNSSASDLRPGVSKDGLEIFWDSDRSGSLGGTDIWTARRSSTAEPWGTAEHLAVLSSAALDRRPFLSWDGDTLLIASTRPGEGAIDEYVATRGKITGR